MKPEDEIFLSAYLDGELDAEERSCVESTMLSDPALIERLRHLAAVNDLLTNLPRPVLRQDIASSVVRRIHERRSASWATRLATVPRSVIGLAAAALVVLSATAGLHLGVWARPDHDPAVARGPVVRHLPAAPTKTRLRAEPEPNVAVAVAPGSDAVPGPRRPTRSRVVADRVDAVERGAERDRDRVRELLDDPNLTRILIVVDEIGGTARDRVETMVRRAPRIDSSFGRISVAQEILIDPRYPGEATVFAVVLSDDELRRLKSELNQEFPKSVEDIAAEPSVVTQLSGIGQVAVLQGTPAADLHSPPATASAPLVAMRTTPRSKAETVQPVPEEFPGLPVVETGPIVSPVGGATDAHAGPERELNRRPRESRGLASTPPVGTKTGSNPERNTAAADPATGVGQVRTAARPEDRSIVLVWVTTQPRRPGVSGPPAS